MLVEIRVPRDRAGAAGHYEKFTRRANDWAIVAVAAVGGRVALANMGATPLRARATEAALAGGRVDRRRRRARRPRAPSPVEDMHADRDYRRHLARVLTARALTPPGVTAAQPPSARASTSSPSNTSPVSTNPYLR